nr:MAG TPA: hypothetical protein [Caudoviricetes sp.]
MELHGKLVGQNRIERILLNYIIVKITFYLLEEYL